MLMGGALNIISLAFAFALLGLGVYIACRILRVIDLTCCASMTLGGCCYAALCACNIHCAIALIIASLLGAIMGMITASLSHHLNIKIPIAGTINLAISHIFMIKMFGVIRASESYKVSILGSCSPLVTCSVIAAISFLVFMIVYKILTSEYGLAMRVYGDGQNVAESFGVNTADTLWTGLAISNALAAISGAFVIQINQYIPPNVEIGVFVFGIGAILFAEKSVSLKNFNRSIIMVTICSFAYKIIIDVVSESIGEPSSYAFSEYKEVTSGLLLIMLIALTSATNRQSKRSILNRNG